VHQADQSILHYLVRVGILDDGHVSGGMTFLDWKEAYYAQNGCKTTSFRVPQNSGAGEDKASKYHLLTKHLNPKELQDLEAALLLRPVDRDHQRPVYSLRFRFIRCFDALGKAIEKANEELSACETMRPGLRLELAEA
jgi:hypothetical protein